MHLKINTNLFYCDFAVEPEGGLSNLWGTFDKGAGVNFKGFHRIEPYYSDRV